MTTSPIVYAHLLHVDPPEEYVAHPALPSVIRDALVALWADALVKDYRARQMAAGTTQ